MILQRIFHFILFGSIFISLCAVALCMQTNLVLGLPLNSFWFYAFVFGATLVQYNLHYVSKTIAIDGSPRLNWTRHQKKTHYILISIGTVLIIASLFSFSLQHYFVLAALGVIAFLYSFPLIPSRSGYKRLKDFGLLKILTLSLLWTLVTVWFPVNRMPFDPVAFAFVFAKRFVFMFILCLLFDIRDEVVDRKQQIWTLAVMLGASGSYKWCYIILGIFVLITVIEFLFFGGQFLVPLLLSATATAGMIEYSKKHNSDITCLFGVDGMMLLQSLLVFLFTLK